MKFLARIIAVFFGVGFIPIAPGTITSLIVVIAYWLFLSQLAWPVFLLMMCLMFLLGVFVSSVYSSTLQQKDPRSITIDEALGQMIPLFLIKPTFVLLAAAFLLFRFFDIIKPFPVNRAERLPSGWGIMADDVVAGLCSGILLNIYLLIR